MPIELDSSEQSWDNLAKDAIINFYRRSGGRGNYDQLIDCKDLKNLVGFSLNGFENAEFSDPENWNEIETTLAESGDKHFSFGEKEDGEVIKAIQLSCGCDEEFYLNVLPVIYHCNSTLFFTPLYRTRRRIETEPHYVDVTAKVYESFGEWEHGNNLPAPCVFIYPTDGILDGLSFSNGVKNSKGSIEVLDTAVDLCELLDRSFKGSNEKINCNPRNLEDEQTTPLCEMKLSTPQVKKIKRTTVNKSGSLWFYTTLKVSSPYGKFCQSLGPYELQECEAVQNNICDTSLESKKDSSLSNGPLIKVEEETNNVMDPRSILENPAKLQDMMRLIKFYSKTSKGSLRMSVLLGFYMNTKFFFYNCDKLLMIQQLNEIAIQCNEMRNFRLTSDREVILGPLTISMKLLERFSVKQIVKLAGGLVNLVQSTTLNDIKDGSRFFHDFDDFMIPMLMELNHVQQKRVHSLSESSSYYQITSPDTEQLKIHFNEKHKIVMHYHNRDYEIPKSDEKCTSGSWFNVMRILEKRLGIFAQIISTIRSQDFSINSGIIFHFTKHSLNLFTTSSSDKDETPEVLPMLVFVLKLLKQNFIPFVVKKSPCGRSLFSLGYGVRFHLDSLFHILKNGKTSIEVLKKICNLDADKARDFNEIKRNLNDDRKFFEWIVKSFKDSAFGIMQVIELRDDFLSDEFKNFVQPFTPGNDIETNGLLFIQSGVYGLLVSIHILKHLSQAERLTMIREFVHLHEDENLMNAIAKVFQDKR